MVGDKKKQDNLAKLEASLAPAEAEFGAVAKADQKMNAGPSRRRLRVPAFAYGTHLDRVKGISSIIF